MNCSSLLKSKFQTNLTSPKKGVGICTPIASYLQGIRFPAMLLIKTGKMYGNIGNTFQAVVVGEISIVKRKGLVSRLLINNYF